MLRSGSTAIVPAGAAGSIMDAAPTKHAASRLQIFPRRCVYIQQGPAGFSLSDGFLRIRRILGHGVPSEPLVAQSLRKSVKNRPPPIREHSGLPDTDYGDSSCQELSATTCLFWSLPLRRGDSERWGTMWPGPNRRRRQQSPVPARSSAHRPPLQSWGRASWLIAEQNV